MNLRFIPCNCVFRYGSVKSAHRRTGKIKGIERILGTVDQLQVRYTHFCSCNTTYRLKPKLKFQIAGVIDRSDIGSGQI